MSTPPCRLRPQTRSLVFAFGLLLLPVLATATPTDPFLALRNASVLGGSSVLLRIEGTFHADDLAQVPFPLQILVRHLGTGTTFLRTDPFGNAARGELDTLADGLQGSDVETLLSTGQIDAPVRIVELSSDRIDLVVPGWFPSGPAEVQLFVWNDGDPVLSNALPVTVAAGGTAP